MSISRGMDKKAVVHMYNGILLSNSGGKEITLVQGKEQRLCFAGAAVKRYPAPNVRETLVR